jgi:hypothetical protein
MGLDQTVTFAPGKTPTFEAVRGLLNRHGFPIQIRMIDGQLAFPDEMPTDNWRELRIGTPQGMVTVRKEPERIICVTWGNADRALLDAWNALTWAFAAAGDGQVLCGERALAAEEFKKTADMPASLKSGN